MWTARDGWPVWGEATQLNESACGSLTVRELQSHDVEGASSDSDGSLAPRFSVMRAWRHASAISSGLNTVGHSSLPYVE